tara:strand:- start:332 stop:544 length:213 start_codon:yes stop_codon:yes gene_type:complete
MKQTKTYNIAGMGTALESAEEFLKIILVYFNDGVLLPDAPTDVREEFGKALAVAGGKCSEALAEYKLHQN